MKKMMIGGLALALLAPGPAQAQRADDMQADVRCVLAMYATMRNPQLAQAAGAASLYFVGRIEGREPTFDFSTGLKREADRMNPSDYNFNARRCFEEIKARNETMKAAAGGLQATKRGVGN